VEPTSPPALPLRTRLAFAAQRAVAFILCPLTTLAAGALLRLKLGLRFESTATLRRTYHDLRRETKAPLLLCANHLTMIDSALIAYALGPPLWYVANFSSLPWNIPDATNFARTRIQQALSYIYKCVPIERGGSREDVANTLNRFTYLLHRGEVGLIFPEGGRSRSGRVEVENAAYGVGRIVKNLPGCRVLCVYLRGERQEGYTSLPRRGDRLQARLACIEPKTDHAGLRGSRDIARQILSQIADLEREHFDALA
jgi:hypothetical protein